jgi:uncharacterized oxidoreductase
MNLSHNKILITGGASGIGLGLAERFLQEDNEVIICGRRVSVLDKAKEKNPALITRVCDLTSEKERIALYEWISKEHPDLNILVNNAGIQNWMHISDADFYERSVNEVNTNILAPLHLTQLFKGLRSLSTIINVTSGLAFSPLSKVPVYCATKAFFHSFTLSLRHMLQKQNIEVIEMVPPALNTDLGGKGLHDTQPPVSDFIDSVFQQMKEGKQQLTFGFSENMVKATPDMIQAAFNRMNP